MFKIRKSQAALEFLTTYAWVFIIILITIAALAYFGVLNPSRLLPDRCNFGPEITCDKDGMVVNNVDADTLKMRLTNSFGTAVIVTGVAVTTDVVAAGTCVAQINDAAISDFSWVSGAIITLSADCATGIALVGKEKIKFNVEVSYYPTSEGEDYTKIIFGEVFTTIQ